MSFDDLEPRRRRGDALGVLLKEDLSLFGLEELEERIEALEGEIGRVKAQMEKKRGSRSDAESLFRK
ncbi:MAG: DUF1192 domain-containing protein [Parvibaculaceae bacterium]|nr:DUF1192 domain-containing protein [Parvibaculaceae bacterium]